VPFGFIGVLFIKNCIFEDEDVNCTPRVRNTVNQI